MAFADPTSDWLQSLPDLRGRLSANAMLSDITWFRVGGPAQVLFTPADEADLVYFLKSIPADVPVFTMGLGSNLLVRDGGVRGVVIRLGRGFGTIEVLGPDRLRVGTAVPDVKVARAAGEAGIAGLHFYRGIPGSIGGALRMNAGAHGVETKDVLEYVRAVDRAGNVHELSVADMGYTYRHCSVPADYIFTQATFRGQPGEPSEILKQMEEVANYREQNQPIRERTGGSTFKNPNGHSAWKLVDQAGCRGLRVGGAKVSEMHCNFLINDAEATAEDVERLGETVRARVKATSGVTLNWEIIRLGEPVEGRPTGEALAELSNTGAGKQ
ncbi:UDP-N-acetylenolpyruvoylglucosamine reductase [Candidatus Filomicrobium marinum]|uniref:UDP-N-acetylenolpyruvoylglucosamine reductase n=1 Tax=Candidatus Filomicrobium marinum TaxID=1608628 RepID=A0A0D6JLI8_9HYPH|nr:UDP-N-acetylmuramate dehydrogenase [Candidatus Filomicrobium marinum]CFX63298.1 UDP-N-acetylenolpyruvoylglucosamine reductase [Candidatus Filomicrobium marinum]CPR22542.1 UDP-N-acetylenolpyruvoylglucosamine reductase [Candidatus Filomicrobium marinum]